MERLSTGIAELDLILGGGLPTASLHVIGGPPGTGKTILANQICFANATPERRAIYYTTLSEPHAKLIRFLEPFLFYDTGAIGQAIEIVHLPIPEDADGLRALADEIVRKNLEARPAMVVIDSSKTLHDFAEPEQVRRIIYDLGSKIAQTNAVLLLVGEYTEREMECTPEFAVADGIIYLANDPVDAFEQRSLRLLKMRGSPYLSGKHSLQIGWNGVEIFARLEAVPPVAIPAVGGRISTGVLGLDEMLGGGVSADSATLVAGPTGAGKTLLALHFVAEGLANGEACHYLSFRESEQQLIRKGDAFGLKLTDAIKSGMLTIRHPRPVELVLDAIGAEVRGAVLEQRSRRVVIDSLGELEHAARDSGRFQDYLWSLVEFITTAGAACLLTTEIPASPGGPFDFTRGLTFATENLILLQYTDLDAHVGRRASVVMMRDSDHAKDPVDYTIGVDGFQLARSADGDSGGA
jgi:circadian clock protein KaiC